MRTEKSDLDWYKILRRDSRWQWYNLDETYPTYPVINVEMHFQYDRDYPHPLESEQSVADRFFESVRAEQARA
jgi:hypothetical protein